MSTYVKRQAHKLHITGPHPRPEDSRYSLHFIPAFPSPGRFQSKVHMSFLFPLLTSFPPSASARRPPKLATMKSKNSRKAPDLSPRGVRAGALMVLVLTFRQVINSRSDPACASPRPWVSPKVSPPRRRETRGSHLTPAPSASQDDRATVNHSLLCQREKEARLLLLEMSVTQMERERAHKHTEYSGSKGTTSLVHFHQIFPR